MSTSQSGNSTLGPPSVVGGNTPSEAALGITGTETNPQTGGNLGGSNNRIRNNNRRRGGYNNESTYNNDRVSEFKGMVEELPVVGTPKERLKHGRAASELFKEGQLYLQRTVDKAGDLKPIYDLKDPMQMAEIVKEPDEVIIPDGTSNSKKRQLMRKDDME